MKNTKEICELRKGKIGRLGFVAVYNALKSSILHNAFQPPYTIAFVNSRKDILLFPAILDNRYY